MRLILHHGIFQWFHKMDLFGKCFTVSFLLHITIVAAYYISTMPALNANNDRVYDSNNMTFKDVEVEFLDLPPSVIMGGETNPAPVEKQEWIEGTGKDKPDAENTDVNINKLSGTGTDPDGYMYADLSDHPPVPIIDFDPNDYFPQSARSANITRKTVMVDVQINENGSIKGAKLASPGAGYGFDEAAIKVVQNLRFRPGKVKGKRVKMLARLPITFSLED